MSGLFGIGGGGEWMMEVRVEGGDGGVCFER